MQKLPKKPFEAHSSGRCPHCRLPVFFDPLEGHWAAQISGDTILVYSSHCPNCKKPIVAAEITTEGKVHHRLVHPFNVVRTAPPEVPKDIREDFQEAAAVLSVSEKASAALSRRCLQNLLNERSITGKNLSDQIDAVLPKLPTDLAENVDYIRVVGNFAAHPIKSQSMGIVVDVESGEASWNLDMLEELFDFFYVRPARTKEKRDKMDKKLKDSGKPPLKKP